MSAPSPQVAVIIPVRNRRDLLRRALDALDGQDVDGFEVVVVDDGSTDGADAEAVRAPVAGRPVRLVRNDGSGAVSARRRGVEATEATVLAFTDSDCIPSPDWLGRALRHIDGGAVLVHGQTLPERPYRPLERSVTEIDFGLFPTCNLVVTRAAYEEVGGFDQSAAVRWRYRLSGRAKGLGFGEDTIFGWAVARRHSAVYDEEMLVRHHVFPADFREWLSRSWQFGAFPALVREVPELRQTLVRRRVLWGKRSRIPVYVTALTALSGRPVLTGTALAWWALHRFRYTARSRDLTLAEELQVLPKQMVLDVVQAAALVSGSVRARTLLL